MKPFQLFRYLNRWKWVIVLVCLLGGTLFVMNVQSGQTYTAGAIIRYTNPQAEQGRTPNGVEIDVTEIYSSQVVTGALGDLGLNSAVDSIRARVTVTEIIPADVQDQKAGLLERGEELTYYPTDYIVSFRAGADRDATFACRVLDSVLKNYFVYYSERYINQSLLPNNVDELDVTKQEYIECADIISDTIQSMLTYLQQKRDHYGSFRSARTGYSFSDLYDRYSFLDEVELNNLYARILTEGLCRDPKLLAARYQSNIADTKLLIDNQTQRGNDILQLIQSYGDKTREGYDYYFGGESADAQTVGTFILGDVYDRVNSLGFTHNTQTTYDALIDSYVDALVQQETLTVDMQHDQYLLECLTSIQSGMTSAQIISMRQTEADISHLVQKMNEYHATVSVMVEDFNEYLGANNIAMLSSIAVQEGTNVRMYGMLAFVAFFLVGCVGVVLLGRAGDFAEYFLYVDPHTGLGNRQRINQVIAGYERKPASDAFASVVLQVVNLGAINRNAGYAAGDRLLGELGEFLKAKSEGFGFVGYNGTGQFVCLFEHCPPEKAQLFVDDLMTALAAYNAEHVEQPIQLKTGMATSATDHTLSAQQLLRLAVARANREG